MTVIASTSPITCRRCGREYVLARVFLPACPHCGAAPIPLRQRLRHNGVAAVLSVLALITLSIAINLPFISMSKLGEERSFSLLGGIMELFHTQQARKRLHLLAVFTGKYSLLDILVVAIIIVLVKFKGLAEAHAEFGTTLFCIAIFLSILAGFAVKLDDPEAA